MCNKNNWETAGEVAQIFPEGFHANLQKLLCNIISNLPSAANHDDDGDQHHLLASDTSSRGPPPPAAVTATPTTRQQPPPPSKQSQQANPKPAASKPQQQRSVSNANRPQVSLPRLEDVDWRIDIKSASEKGRMSVPTVLVQMNIQKNKTKVDAPDETEKVIFEVGRAELETMLEGLGRIRDQLNTVAGTQNK